MKCICCKSEDLVRVRRKFWHRLLWWSRRYHCSGCGATFLKALAAR